jgi:hypothetical protein
MSEFFDVDKSRSIRRSAARKQAGCSQRLPTLAGL